MSDYRWKGFNVLGTVLTLSIQMVGSIALGYFLGSYLDKVFGTSPWLTLIMFLLGLAAGFKTMYFTMFPPKKGE